MSLPPADPPDRPAGAPGEHRRAQMADIARLAGVSVSTVSRALQGHPRIGAETRRRIEELARSVHYAVNVGAQNLRLGHNRTVAVVIPYDRANRQPIADPFFLAMVGSLADALTERGFAMLLSRVDADDLGAAARAVDSGQAIGAILIGQWRHHDQLEALAARRVPLVVWGTRVPGQRYCTVGGDNVAGGRLAAGHLLQAGRRRIAFLGDPALPEVADRHQGYRDAHHAHSLAPDPLLLLPTPFDAEAGRRATAGLCRAGTPFDAVVACSDVLASAAMQALHAHGLAVPGDVAVVGYDDTAWASQANPPLTTVRQPVGEAGDMLVDALLQLLAGGEPAPRTLAVELVVRASSGAG